MKRKSLGLMIVLILSIFAFTGCSPTASKVGTAPDGSEIAIEKATMKFMKDTQAGGYKLVSTEDLNKWVNEKKALIIIDTMPADSFAKGHIPGAVNAELPKTTLADATDEQKAAFIKLLGEDKSKTVVVYCGYVACARSDVGAVLAKQQGFNEVYRLPGGITTWQEAKYDVAK
ncbi:rhodanese-like domain-containing protein [Desulfosporosinus meridiei]|uniref:Rhodanese-related sulfurtransferase n=1 Tax=Desulfosporosinus meridiei (strain ATCC BAA-275 / DSM 13257 / KCTC 12902 / NCIMB 13706 / S10) TaxID=768704 RepID=J7IXI4_DESMD|nr:rhodanese-like domain-containing protein [Desulfosporosinus meridiei]AFQ43421.1 Rhodanese-related sulfurtransferase [Desulfosporosinus meridiei DSM 13257]